MGHTRKTVEFADQDEIPACDWPAPDHKWLFGRTENSEGEVTELRYAKCSRCGFRTEEVKLAEETVEYDSWWCRLGLHRFRRTHRINQAGRELAVCRRCGKREWRG